MKHWKAILAVAGIFLLGALAGGLVTARVIQRRAQHMAHRPHAVEEMIVRRLSWRLGLDEAQRMQLRAIVRDGQQEMQPLRREMEAVLERAASQTRLILRPEQREKFDKFAGARRAKWGGPPAGAGD